MVTPARRVGLSRAPSVELLGVGPVESTFGVSMVRWARGVGTWRAPSVELLGVWPIEPTLGDTGSASWR